MANTKLFFISCADWPAYGYAPTRRRFSRCILKRDCAVQTTPAQIESSNDDESSEIK